MKVPVLFGEEDFQEKMDTVVADFLKKSVTDGFFAADDGAGIHYYYAVHPQEKASIVISHGFCEFFAKYHELAYYFYQMGYSVFFLEHRGHGYSQREVPEIDKVYIKSYDRYVEDLKCFVDQIVTKKSQTKRYILFAHSMGGGIGALFLEKYPEIFQKAVLSSPLMQMNFQGIPDIAVKVLLFWSVLAHWNTRYVPKQHGYDGIYTYKTSSTLSEPRYAYAFYQRELTPEFRTYGGCYSWTRATIAATKKLQKNAEKVQVPVLLFQAGCDSMVMPKGQEIFVERSGNTRMVRYKDSKHEIFNATPEIRDAYYREIFTFLEEQ